MTIRPNWRALRSWWGALRPEWRAVSGLGLLAAGGILVGFGFIADGSAEDPSGAPTNQVSPQADAAAPDTTDAQTSPANHDGDTTATTTKPVDAQRLKIPSLGIDAPVLPITADGASLVPPSDPQTVGWWSDGARPGADHGTAILTGHTVSTGGGVFDDLEHLHRGQRVQILSPSQRLNLQVTSVTTYHKTTLADHAAEIFNQTTQGRVALVTCEDFDGTEYRSNVVVLATPMA